MHCALLGLPLLINWMDDFSEATNIAAAAPLPVQQRIPNCVTP